VGQAALESRLAHLSGETCEDVPLGSVPDLNAAKEPRLMLKRIGWGHHQLIHLTSFRPDSHLRQRWRAEKMMDFSRSM